MRKSNDEKLVASFPLLYRDRYGDMNKTAMVWGFEVGDGWFDLIWDLSAQLEKLIFKLPENEREFIRATQVKEKFGGLRFYMTMATEEMDEIIHRAEEQSFQICELCGNEGNPNYGGWISVRCETCRKGAQKK